ncbi:Protein enhancer of rudimentary [Diplonema papillatum]|nr:Protein enhancer of rudimentary [Diplonema papillatum]
MSHTILLCQPTPQKSSRIYSDYESLDEAMSGVCQMYETRLKQENPKAADIQYDVADLLHFVGTLTDMSVLIFDVTTKVYKPFGRDWIKNQVYAHLKKQAA